MGFSLIAVLFFVLLAGAIFISSLIIRYVIFTSTEGAVKRLKDDIEKANALQSQLGLKLKSAEEELAKRQAEAKALTEKMRSEAEESSKAEREKIIAQARTEGEEIIAKAQNAKQKIAEELEKENDIRMINFSMEMVNEILSQKAKYALEDVLVTEFLDNLKSIDMSRISPDVTSVDVITVNSLQDKHKLQLTSLIKEKVGRDLTLKTSVDPKLGGGMMLKFGSMALDGSIKNLIRESSVTMMQKVSAR